MTRGQTGPPPKCGSPLVSLGNDPEKGILKKRATFQRMETIGHGMLIPWTFKLGTRTFQWFEMWYGANKSHWSFAHVFFGQGKGNQTSFGVPLS